MKTVLLLGVCIAFLAVAEAQSRGCIYVEGHCQEACKEGTHAYTTGCGYMQTERTCDNPVSVLDKNGGHICDYTRCECDEPRVKDLSTGNCVLLEDCPKKDNEIGSNRALPADRV